MPDQTEVTDAPETESAPVPTTPTPAKKVEFEDVYLRYRDEHGLNPNGNPEMLDNIGITLQIPTMLGGEVVPDAVRTRIEASEKVDDRLGARIIPGTRIVHIKSRAIAEMLIAQTGLFQQIEPPKKAEIDKAKAETQDAANEAGTFDQEN